MAGDWIKVREDIHEDPAVLQMASRLKTRPEHVVGYCVRFWSWVSRNCHAGSVTNVTLMSLESVINLPGFCNLLCEVGWLEYQENSDGTCTIRIPKFERHLSQGAKTRVLTNERQRKKRVTEMSRSQRDKSVTREEKRREKKVKKEISPVGFEVFYANYPLHKSRKAAEKEFTSAVQSLSKRPEMVGKDIPAWLAERAAAYARECQGRETRYIAHPSTWLHQGKYDDESTPLFKATQKPVGPPPVCTAKGWVNQDGTPI